MNSSVLPGFAQANKVMKLVDIIADMLGKRRIGEEGRGNPVLLAAIHAKHVTVMEKDMVFIRKILKNYNIM